MKNVKSNPTADSAMMHSREGIISIEEYAAEIRKSGKRVVPGVGRTFWVEHEKMAMIRMPIFILDAPAPEDIREVFRSGRTMAVSYLLEPDDKHPANSWLYVCSDQAYSLDKLSRSMRRNVRIGLSKLRIAPVTRDELLSSGMRAFCDTRQRVGVSDGTPEEFKKRFVLRAKSPGNVFLGAWKNDELAAFLSITEVDDWAEIEGTFSTNATLSLKPNDTLVFSALHHYLVEEKRRIMSYGLSSIQPGTSEAGLHEFKMRAGFEAKAVRRLFALHPLCVPIANRLTLKALKTALHLRPSSRVLKKACGVLELMLNEGHPITALENAAGREAPEDGE